MVDVALAGRGRTGLSPAALGRTGLSPAALGPAGIRRESSDD